MIIFLLSITIILAAVCSCLVLFAFKSEKLINTLSETIKSLREEHIHFQNDYKHSNEGFDELVTDYIEFKKEMMSLNKGIDELSIVIKDVANNYESVQNNLKEIDILINSSADDRFFYNNSKSMEGVNH